MIINDNVAHWIRAFKMPINQFWQWTIHFKKISYFWSTPSAAGFFKQLKHKTIEFYDKVKLLLTIQCE